MGGIFLIVAVSLTVLLVGTTPVGTGAGIHQFDLVHPLLSHTHLINGQLVTHEQMAAAGRTMTAPAPVLPGPVISAGHGTADELASGPSPLPAHVRLTLWQTDRRVQRVLRNHRPPTGQIHAPPDPPPLSLDRQA